ncbi:Uncharacterised protein [Mycolicibacterium fortuitum]|uniref:Uncharacterized protein n=1 Tax=Mycolicibacterium fortuitum TaxID=1766 RepID=A0A378U7Y5_MYCFO|nr:Uncharacterised protein [Mycolicibacterium fortuitum]
MVDGILVGHVDRDEQAVEFLSGSLAGGRVDIAHHDGGTLGVQPAPGGQTDAARTAGDDGNLASQALGQIH